MALEKYKEKRNFKRTAEPPPVKASKDGPLTFVIQKHRARQLHYDFRLELDGVLKSWSVPKGPSLDPADKRLAVMVEDHPIDYAAFEGNIPKGEYGGGEVLIWDSGAYSPDEGGTLLFNDRAEAQKQMRLGMEKGKLSFTLRGNKLKGSWTLVRLQKKEKNWLLMKHRDEFAGPGTDVLKEEKSVASGRTIEEIKTDTGPSQDAAPSNPEQVPGAVKAPFPTKIAPMLATLTTKPFSKTDWIFEPKLDGYRIIAAVKGGKVTLLSRNGNNVTKQYGSIVPELESQPASEIVLDGEMIAMDEKGKQCFQCLQNYLKSAGKGDGADTQYPLVYYVFDILYLDGYDLQKAPLRARKELLNRVFKPGQQVKLISYFENDGETVYKASIKNGLEGVVAKQLDSVYEAGKRSQNWLKIKGTQSDEFVIGGYSTASKERANTFSSLLLGRFNNKGDLVFAGHVGTGFNDTSLAELKSRLDPLQTKKSPFSQEPPLNAPTTWVRPELVAEVKFSEWTQDGRLRAPVFLRLREDKSPEEIKSTETVTLKDLPPPKAGPKRRKTAAAKTDDPPGDPPAKHVRGTNDAVIKQLQTPENDTQIEVDGYKISISNLDKVLWPAADTHPGYTKRDFLVYLAQVSPYMLPHLKDRPLSLNRFPDGINGEHFFQKHWGHPTPDFVTRVDITGETSGKTEYLICDNLASLLWMGQVANLEFHTWFSRTKAEPDMAKGKGVDYYLDYPDFVIFDLDPYIYSGKEKSGEEPELNREGFDAVGSVALRLKKIVDELSLKAFIKTSGKTGLHLHVPIIRRFDYKTVRGTAEIIGKYMVQKYPDEITTEWAQEKRKGKIFFDYGQNVRGKTLACIYSPRPAPDAAVSTPLRWEELGKVYPTEFTIKTLPARLKKTGDLWAGILSEKRDLEKLSALK